MGLSEMTLNNNLKINFKAKFKIQSPIFLITFLCLSLSSFQIKAQTEDDLFNSVPLNSDSSLENSDDTALNEFMEEDVPLKEVPSEGNSFESGLDSDMESKTEKTTDSNQDAESELSEFETDLQKDGLLSEDVDALPNDANSLPSNKRPANPLTAPSPRRPSPSDLSNEDYMTKDVEGLQGQNVKASQSKRVKFIKHPGQKQGLYKISADGKYYYKITESKQKYGLAVKGGALVLNQLESINGTRKFSDIYGSSAKPSVYVEYYWSFFKNKDVPNILKKARVKIGSGLLFATGQGSFNDPNYVGVDSGESLTFLAFPNNIGLHLSLEVKDKQLVVPFVTGALEYLVGIEMQNDNLSKTKFLGQLGAHFGGGLALSLGWLEESAKFDLDAEWGINQTYLVVELRQNIAIQSDFNFTATFINAGIQFEF